jgi:hypothetical protein
MKVNSVSEINSEAVLHTRDLASMPSSQGIRALMTLDGLHCCALSSRKMCKLALCLVLERERGTHPNPKASPREARAQFRSSEGTPDSPCHGRGDKRHRDPPHFANVLQEGARDKYVRVSTFSMVVQWQHRLRPVLVITCAAAAGTLSHTTQHCH